MMYFMKSLKNGQLAIILFDFFIGGFTGWIYETVITSIYLHRFEDRGVLPIPILPIYGLFAIAVVPLFKNEKSPFFIGAVGAILATVFELIAAFFTEYVCGYRLWTYEHWPLNFFGGRISVFSSIVFGILCVLFVKVLHPLGVSLYKRFQNHFSISVLIIALMLFVCCFIPVK